MTYRLSGLITCLLALALVSACGGDEGGGETQEGGPPPVQVEGDAQGLFRDNTAEKGKLEAAIAEYYAAMKAGDVDRVFETFAPGMVTAIEQQMSYMGDNPRDALAETWKSSAANLTHEVLEEDFQQLDKDGVQQAMAKVKTVTDGVDDDIEFWFQKLDGRWRITMMDSRRLREEARAGLEALERDRPKDD
jgi:hypothetical protein